MYQEWETQAKNLDIFSLQTAQTMARVREPVGKSPHLLGRRLMAIHCIHCGTKLPDAANFCLICGKPPRGASAASVTTSPKAEYKQMYLDLSNGPIIEYPTLGHSLGSSSPGAPPGEEKYRQSKMAAQQLILIRLKPLFDEGWQLHGSFDSAVSIGWRPRGSIFPKGRLHDATVRLIRYR